MLLTTRDSGIKYGGACIAAGRDLREIMRWRDTMNNRYVDRVGWVDRIGQKDREFEELLCLAYLFTHSVYDESPDESEIPLVDDAELFQNFFCN